MFSEPISKLLLLVLLLPTLSLGQLSGKVGPTTSHAAKRAKICSVLDYGGKVGSSDIGPAILSAFNNCVVKQAGSTLYVPAGNYNMATWVTLSHGTSWAFQLDGIITRTSTTGGNMIAIQSANDFEMYSSNSAGGIQGSGYQCRNAGPRLLRFIDSTNVALHDLIMVDSPEFHFTCDTCTNTEIYNLAIRGADIGGSDGIDIWGTNIWVHDVMVTNRDECVTVKNPSNNIMVERIFCNQSGGSAIGSLGANTSISNVVYKNIYNMGGNQMFMIKSNGGSGSVRNLVLDSFYGVNTAYALIFNEYWESAQAAGNGVLLTNITVSNWDGYIVDGNRRSTVAMWCSDGAPCTNIKLSNVNLWSANNVGTYSCQSAYGSGACLKSGSGGSYATAVSSYSKPAAYSTPPTMAGALASGFATNAPIPLPTIPTSFYPGLPQYSPLAKNGGSGVTSGSGGSGGSTSSPTTTTSAPAATQTQYGQCGGIGYTGPTVCASGLKCTYSSDYYSQCL